MFFTLIAGTPPEIARCHHALQGQAAWLGATVSTTVRAAAGDWSVVLCEYGRGPRFTSPVESVLIGGAWRADDAIARMLSAATPPRPALFIDRSTLTLTALIPPATPEPMYVHTTSQSVILSDDLRVMAAVAGAEVDPAGACALLQFGFTPPPLTLFRSVERLPGGSVVRIDLRRREVAVTPIVLDTHTPPTALRPSDPEPWITQTLDRTLAAVTSSADLYFSGGVDSSLLAARLWRLGRTDVRLVHFSFGADDEETTNAQRVATRLGLRFDQVNHTEGDTEIVAGRIGRDYSFPFGDASVLPSNVLAHASIDRSAAPSQVIDGTGADGSFAVPCSYRTWRALYAIPPPIRALAAGCYRQLQLWRSDHIVARRCQTMRRSVQWPLEQAALATNAFEGIAYRTPTDIRSRLQAAFDAAAHTLRPGVPADARLGLLDVMHLCAGVMAAKTYEPLRARGITPLYPYLSPAMVSGAAQLPRASKCQGAVAKAPLKVALARELPAELVYRRKVGFTPPYRPLFSSPQMIHLLRDLALAPTNPLLDYCRVDVVRRLIDDASRRTLNVSGCDFLWSLAFSSIWLAQIRDARTTTAVDPLPLPSSCAASLVS